MGRMRKLWCFAEAAMDGIEFILKLARRCLESDGVCRVSGMLVARLSLLERLSYCFGMISHL